MAHVDAASIVAAAADLFNTIAAYRTTHATPEPTDNAHLSLISLAARQPPPPIRHVKGVRASCESKLAEGSVQSITKPCRESVGNHRPGEEGCKHLAVPARQARWSASHRS